MKTRVRISRRERLVFIVGGTILTLVLVASLLGDYLGRNDTGFDIQPGTYSVTETADGWKVVDIRCSDTDSSVDVEAGTATYSVSPGEIVECTFIHSLGPVAPAESCESMDSGLSWIWCALTRSYGLWVIAIAVAVALGLVLVIRRSPTSDRPDDMNDQENSIG